MKDSLELSSEDWLCQLEGRGRDEGNFRRQAAEQIDWQKKYGSSQGYMRKNKATYCVSGMEQDNELGRNMKCFICLTKLSGFYPQDKTVTLKRFEIDQTTVSCLKTFFLNSEKNRLDQS